jgi:transposase-like protein
MVFLEIERSYKMGSKSKLSVSERREVVLSLLRRDEPARVLARRYGISENTLYRWRDEFMAAGEAALANGTGKADPRQRHLAELKKQLGERDKVIGELTIANRLLKKTADLSS